VANSPPRNVEIKGQPHMLSYITPEEGDILQSLGGSGAPGPMGIPSYFSDQSGADSATGEAAAAAGMGGGDDSQTYGAKGGTGSNFSNVTNMANYSPSFARGVAMSQGLDPKGLLGFNSVGLTAAQMMAMGIDPATGKAPGIEQGVMASLAAAGLFGNTVQQNAVAQAALSQTPAQQNQLAQDIQQDIANGYYGSAAQAQGIAGMRGDDLGFTASALGFSPGTLGPDGMMTGNPYGPGMMAADQVSLMSPVGAMMGIARGLGLVDGKTRGVTTTTPVDYFDTVTKGINYGQVPGNNATSFGNFGAISDSFSNNMSAIGKNMMGALKEGIGFLSSKGNPSIEDHSTSVPTNQVSISPLGTALQTSGARDAYGTPVSVAQNSSEKGIGSLGIGKSYRDTMENNTINVREGDLSPLY
jgi:hypothetical protein